MNVELNNELKLYLMGQKSYKDIMQWISSISWDDDMEPQLSDVLSLVELILTEINEGIRNETDFRRLAVDITKFGSEVDIYPSEKPGLTVSNSTSSSTFTMDIIGLFEVVQPSLRFSNI